MLGRTQRRLWGSSGWSLVLAGVVAALWLARHRMRWLSGFERAPRITYLVHGEPSGLNALAARIAREREWPVAIAQYRQRVQLP